MRAVTDANDVRRAMNETRVMDDRDYEGQQEASRMYEELRTLDDRTLSAMAGYRSSRPVMIAEIIAQWMSR